MQVLFIHNKPVILAPSGENIQGDLEGYKRLENVKEPGIAEALRQLKGKELKGLYIATDQPALIFESLFQIFQHWCAAGGLITNPKGEILLLFRRGKWDLPKGKMEADENPEDTALREVSEETGLRNIKIIKKLTDTWHSYPISVYKITAEKPDAKKNQKEVLKQTFWYEMAFTGEELTIPQIEEDIVDIQWIKPENVEKYLSYSYPNIRQVFAAAGYRV